MANNLALQTSLPDTIIYCNLQISKDGGGYCLSSLNLANTTNIADLLPDGPKSYVIDGQPMQGYFTVDYTAEQLSNFSGMSFVSFSNGSSIPFFFFFPGPYRGLYYVIGMFTWNIRHGRDSMKITNPVIPRYNI